MALTIAAQQPMHDTHAVVEDGAVDADGHILEPPTLWEEYIDPAFRDRALRFRIDEHGLEELEIDGRRLVITIEHAGGTRIVVFDVIDWKVAGTVDLQPRQ